MSSSYSFLDWVSSHWAHFTVHRFICVYLCVYFMCFCFHTAYVLYFCEHGGVDLMGLKLNPLDISSFIALTLLVLSFDPQKPIADMTYNVFGGTLNLARQQQQLDSFVTYLSTCSWW